MLIEAIVEIIHPKTGQVWFKPGARADVTNELGCRWVSEGKAKSIDPANVASMESGNLCDFRRHNTEVAEPAEAQKPKRKKK